VRRRLLTSRRSLGRVTLISPVVEGGYARDASPRPTDRLPGAALLFPVGIAVHLAFAPAERRSTPITLFAFGPPIAALAYLRVRPAVDQRHLAGLLLWGLVSTAVAFFVVLLAVQSCRYIPDGRSTYELFRFDPDVYVQFVVGLAGTVAAAARRAGRRRLALLAVAPVVQLAVPVAFIFVEQWLTGSGAGF